jgi:uncharacterized RDD family membrane protein YckC
MDEVCPKCGYDQIENDECLRCRVIVSKYQSYLASFGKKPSPIAPTTSTEAGTLEERGEWEEGTPGGFWIRAAASIVDSLALGAALLPFILFVVVPTLVAGGMRRADQALFLAVYAGYSLVVVVINAGYLVWMHGRWGQTLGKIANGVRVVSVDGEPIGYGQAFARMLVVQVPVVLMQVVTQMTAFIPMQVGIMFLSFIWLGITYLMAAFRSDKRGLHDLIAGTRVIKVRRAWLEGKPAGFWMRFVALFLDWEVLTIPAGLFGILLAVTLPVIAASGVQGPLAAALGLTVGLFFVAFLILYSIWMHGKWGQTLGKMAIGVKVVTNQGEKIGYGTAFLRWISSVVSAIILLIGYLIAGFRSDKRSLHDLIAGTRVVWIR